MLDAIQQQVVDHHNGSILVKAGPGSGKTKTVIERCSSMVASGIQPHSILVVTFTREAAYEIRRRVEDQAHGAGICMLTIHALGYLILRETLKERCPTLIDEEQAYERYISACRRCGKMPTSDGLLEIVLSKANFEDKVKDELTIEYIRILSKNNEMDMGDLVTLPYILFRNNKVLTNWRNKWSHITIDEAHDCTPVEARFISLLADKNLCIIFDENQSIYGWRGGSPKTISTIRDFTTYQLPATYRCPSDIYNAAWLLINKHTDQHALSCMHSGGDIEVVYNDNIQPTKNTMVLCRTQEQVHDVEHRLTASGFSVNIKGGIFDSYEANVILAYAKATVGDESGWNMVLKNPFQTKTKQLIRMAKRAVYKKPLELFMYNWMVSHFMIDKEATEKYEKIMHLCNGSTKSFIKKIEARQTPNNNVRVMTLHGAKGLESDHVILYNASEGMMPHKNEKDISSERRLFYVGITRAKKRLTILTQSNRESRFLYEAGILGGQK